MAELSLRAYLDYIEDRLKRDAYTEVIAQCRHILLTYPKQVATYRLLARALAAQENYQDALDLFQRVLSSDPNDFIAHIGMSDCYRESDAIAPAIWHLERAFEQAPNNAELQDEIKKLYAMRGAKAPRRVGLTGGALARLYAKGKLYPQAISELEKAITLDPERLDLQTLLAEVLWESRQEVKAGRAAAEVLKRLPFNLQANRILAQLWLKAGKPNEARPFLERVRELDPYLGYRLEHDGEHAPDHLFKLVMLDFTPERRVAEAESADWVLQLSDPVEKSKSVTGPLKPLDSVTDVFTGDQDAGPVAPDAPDWLQEVMAAGEQPPESAEAPPAPPSPASGFALGPSGLADPEDEALPGWLQARLAEDTGPLPEDEDKPPAWLQDALGETPASHETARFDEPPEETTPVEPSAPDWLSDVLQEETPPLVREGQSAEGEGAGDTPAWLDEVLAAETPPAEETAGVDTADLSPRLSEDDLGKPTPVAPSPTVTFEGLSDLPDWDDSPAGDSRAEPDVVDRLDLVSGDAPEIEPVTTGQDDALPALQEDRQVAPPFDEPTDDDTPDWLTEGDLDSDEALSWLEEIAAKYDPDFQKTTGEDAEAEEEAGPEPIEAEIEVGEAPGWPEEEPAAEPAQPPRLEGVDVPDWLRVEAEPAPAAEVEPAAEPEEEAEVEALPDWLIGGEPAPAAEVEPAAEQEAEEEALPDWLIGGEPAPAAEAEPAVEAEAEAEEEEEALPDWLQGEPEPSPKAAPEPAATDQLPAWLSGEPAAAADSHEELDWLRRPLEAAEEEEGEGIAEVELPAWLQVDAEKEKPAAEPEVEAEVEEPVAPAEPAEALSWLDEQVAEQGVSPEEAVSESLTPDRQELPPSPLPPLDAEAEPVSADALPDWLRVDEEAQAEIARALDEPAAEPEMAEIPEQEVEQEELAWLEKALRSEDLTAAEGDELEAILSADQTPPLAEVETSEEAVEVEELPAWLRDEPAAEVEAEEAEEAELPAWLVGEEQISRPAVAEQEADEVPAWLREEPEAGETSELPTWLQAPAEAADTGLDDFLRAVEPAPPAEQPEPTPTPAMPLEPVPEPVAEVEPEPEPAVEAEPELEPVAEAEPEPVAEAEPEPEPAPVFEPVAKPTSLLPEQPVAAVPEPAGDVGERLGQAREQLAGGDVAGALAVYDSLVDEGAHLEETVADLQDLTERKSVGPEVFRVIGDALRAQDRFDEALEMYTKALDQF
jgi:tetratricopeptide (TPR) repeat protein